MTLVKLTEALASRFLSRGEDQHPMSIHLRLQGMLERGPELPVQSWTTIHGIEIAIDGRSIEINWRAAPNDSATSWQEMEQAVTHPLAIELLQVGAPMRIRWAVRRSTPTIPAAAGATFMATVQAQGWVSTRAPGALALHSTDAAKLERHDELRQAIEELERGMEVWEGEALEALGRLYRAVEVLVRATIGSSRRGSWGSFGASIGIGRDEALQLFDSLQSGRHVDVSDAAVRLKAMGKPQLDPAQCMNAVREVISKALVLAS